MGWKIINITEAQSISFYLGSLLVKKENNKFFIPLSDVDVLLISTCYPVITSRLLVEMAKRNILVIQCNEKYIPVLQLVPLEGNYKTAGVFRMQLEWDYKLKGDLWKQIITQKIENQSQLLKRFSLDRVDELQFFKQNIKHYDLTNREGHAAKIYFTTLFGSTFKREDENNVKNAMLDYGYSILRAYFCRSIVAKGLDPRIGIFHRSIFNFFALASDLMEPLRPFVDHFVYLSMEGELNSDFKRKIMNHFNEKVIVESRAMYITDAVTYIVEELYRNQRIAEINCNVGV
jgi:CRISPR-associated protein Cas1